MSPNANPTPGPDHRDLYVIIIGIVVGILIGPAVLERARPDIYQRFFVGGVAEQRELEAYQGESDAARRALIDSGVTGVAVSESDAQRQPRLIELTARVEEARRQHAFWLVGRMTGIILAILVVMIIETLVDPRSLWARSRLAAARYGLIAIWLAILLARPVLLHALPLAFIGLLAAVALATALVPLRRSQTRA